MNFDKIMEYIEYTNTEWSANDRYVLDGPSIDFECLKKTPAIGTRVKIINQPYRRYKRYELAGKEGTVCATYSNNLAIQVDGMFNNSSGLGYFYFDPKDLLYIDEFVENNDKEEENTMPKIKNYLNAVRVTLVGNSSPCNELYANFESGLTVNDMCVVKRPNHQLTVATVVEIVDANELELNSEVVARVDMHDYDYRVESRRLAAELKAKMEERARKLQDVALYKMLAENDSEMQDLLNRYQSLPTV